MLFSDKQNNNQINLNCMEKTDASVTFCKVLEKIVTFSSFNCLKTSVFFLLLFAGYYLALFVFYLQIDRIFKLVKYPINETFILI